MKKILLRLFVVVTIPVWVPLVVLVWCGTGIVWFIGWQLEQIIRYVLTGDSKTKFFTDNPPF